jgi:hypothetical protein
MWVVLVVGWTFGPVGRSIALGVVEAFEDMHATAV